MEAEAIADRVSSLLCGRCGDRQPAGRAIDSRGCPDCRETAPANYEVFYTSEAIDARRLPTGSENAGLWRYDPFLPVAASAAVSLGEGNTPLCRVDRLASELGLECLFVKDESRNPTWSYKDRFSTVTVSHAVKTGAGVVATASSGNAGASLAAYAAKAAIPCVVATFSQASGALLQQVHKYGAMILPLEDMDQRWPILQEASTRFGWFISSPFTSPVVGSHPIGIEGYKTIAYETYEQLGRSLPDWFVLPVAYGDALSGIWRGFKDLRDMGLCSRLPRMVATEAYGSIGKTLATSSDRLFRVNPPSGTKLVSIATAQSTYQALKAVRESGGHAITIDEDEIVHWQEYLASREGLFLELSSVTPVLATKGLVDQGVISPSDKVVCLATASGMKDLEYSADPEIRYPTVKPGLENALCYLRDHYSYEPGNP